MSDQAITNPPEPENRGTWLDKYMPENRMATQSQQGKLISLPTIRGILFRQRWLIAGIMVAAAIAGLIVTLLATPMYEARSSVRIEPYGSYIVEGQNVEQGISSNQVYDLLSTQISIINSRSLAQTVAENLNLGERYDLLGGDIDENRPPNLSDEAWAESKQGMAASILYGSVGAELPSDNWIIEIIYRSENPVLAAEMANAYAEAFAAFETRDTLDGNEYAQTVLRERIETVRQRLKDAEDNANTYARKNGIVVQATPREDGEGTVTVTSSNLASINASASAATANRIAAEQRWRSVQGLPASQLPEVQGNPVLQELIAERTNKQAELVDLRQRYTDEFPRVQNLLGQISALDAQIDQSSGAIKAAVRNAYIVARNQEQALQRELNSATGDTLAEQDRQVQYSVLEREAQALRDQLQALLTRFNEVSTAANVQSGLINPLDMAVVPGSPYAPSLMRNLGLSLVLGAAFAAGLAVLRETLDDLVRSFEEVEDKLGLPLLGHTPFVAEADLDTEGENRFSALIEAYASIRSTIDFAIPRDKNVIQLTSSQAAEGKSTTAVILAELFAGVGRKTLLIDGDLRHPTVAQLVGKERPEIGFVEVLLGQADLKSAIISGVHENLDILPVGKVPGNPTELFASKQLDDFIAKYRQEYSLIVFDSSPILGLADAPMLARKVDATIFVMEANRVNFGQARSAIKRLSANGGNPVGAILTKYRALEAGQDYNYQYGYYEYESSK
ncbi:GumC family protein [Erythrobacter crassostreae]|uniref:non-specific protein-tyrosine kinase n=1 Tax=Erythrobacter crassostreae TaxID=2828328 RepID=A0A9X1F0U5_9SPHN|nr:polysaccharide biosynthesis tyrosine autokinase [Erythrobacter crassostrea]MBV7258270.1 polysaccharide biosynthesis tyrosine autokinase [Erythrobacter crassostrea]